VLGFNLLFFLGLASTDAIHGALIGAAAPAATALLATFVLHERLRTTQWIGVALSLAGVVAVVANGSSASLGAPSIYPGDLLIAAAVACWAIYTVAGGGLVRRNGPVSVAAYAYFMATAFALPIAGAKVAVDGAPTLSASWTVWAALLFLGTVSSVLGFVWWNEGMAVLGPSRTGIFYNLVPVSGIVLGSLLLGEPVTTLLLAGAALVCAGIVLTVCGAG
jgi:drug/metabolite transporter (DMT)-like permease